MEARPIYALKAAQISQNQEKNQRNCSEIMQKLLETKKVARILEVAKKLPSNLWKALGTGGGETAQ